MPPRGRGDVRHRVPEGTLAVLRVHGFRRTCRRCASTARGVGRPHWKSSLPVCLVFGDNGARFGTG